MSSFPFLIFKQGGFIGLQNAEVVARRCSVNKVFLEVSQNSQENTCARISFLIKLQASACNFMKKRLWQRCFLKRKKSWSNTRFGRFLKVIETREFHERFKPSRLKQLESLGRCRAFSHRLLSKMDYR